MEAANLDIKNVKKIHSTSFCLGPVNLSIPGGTVQGIMGPNGAGKTTLFSLITGNLDASDGAIFFLTEKMTVENASLKRKMGYLPQELSLPQWLTVRDILVYAYNLWQLPRDEFKDKIQTRAKFWDCHEYLDRPFASCSYGMQKRAGLCLATLHDPLLLILDEPFSGLDISHVFTLEDYIEERKVKKMTTIFSTHVPQFAAKHCDGFSLMENGQLNTQQNWPSLNMMERIDFIEDYFRNLKAKL